MTHDELVDIAIAKDLNKLIRKQMKAIDAVFELHKSVQSYMFEDSACLHCSSEEDRVEILYPCPTIQAIEKELS